MTCGKAVARTLHPGPQAVQELQVYLRTMGLAQRRWARQIAYHENEVRRLMLLEEHHRDRLRQSALHRLSSRLRHLANTDLATAAAHVAPPASAPQLLSNCGVRADQVTAFSMYALARFSADPDRINGCTRAELTNAIADMQSGWEVVAPTKKTAYAELASGVRARLQQTTRAAQSNSAKQAVKGRCTASTAGPSTSQPPRKRHAQRASDCTTYRVDGAPWETIAFRTFCAEAKHLFAAALGCADGGSVPEAQWEPIARAEWATKTLRQKRLYHTRAPAH